MTLFLLYIWLKLDSFRSGLDGFAFACGMISFFSIAFLMGAFSGFDPKERPYQIGRRIIKWTIPLCAVSLITAGLLPTQKEGAYLIAGYAGLKLAETPEMGKLAEVVRLKVGNYLDDELTAARSEAAKKIKDAASQAVSK